METVTTQAREVVTGIAMPVLQRLQPLVQPIHQGHLYFQDVLSTDHNAIPHMAWEEYGANLTGLSLSQFRFTVALFVSVLLAPGLRLLRHPTFRHLYSLLTGVALVYYPFGSGIVHILPLTIAAYLVLLLAPRHAGVLAWCTVFPYLIYLHVVNASGESWKSGKMDFTGGAMVAVLKLIAMCVCRQDSFRKNKEDLIPYQAAHQLVSTPGPLELLSYVFGMGNLLAGPFIEFSEYKEFMELRGPWSPTAPGPTPPVAAHGLLMLLESMLYMTAYLALTLHGWGFDHYHSPWFHSQSVLVKCGVFLLLGMLYQLRYFFTWKVCEVCYVLAGLDFLGYDEDTDKPRWGRCRNCHFVGVWMADSARNVPLNWNICTGTFLRRYVYERVTPRNRRPGFQSLLFTQLVSAIWHGLYPGYVMFFAGSALWIYFSQILYKMEAFLPVFICHNLLYRAIKVLWTAFVLNYMSSAFQVLDFKTSLEVYASVRYFPFIVMITVNLLGSFVKTKRPLKKLPTGPITPPTKGRDGSKTE